MQLLCLCMHTPTLVKSELHEYYVPVPVRYIFYVCPSSFACGLHEIRILYAALSVRLVRRSPRGL